MSKKTKRNPDHVKRHNTPTINNEVISHPAELFERVFKDLLPQLQHILNSPILGNQESGSYGN